MKCPEPIFVRKTRLLVPCGKCAACRARKANEWIIRLNVEFKNSVSAYFVTLTYDDFNIPYTNNGYETLKKTDLQEFINLLRQYCPFRYFSIGEYGDKGQRPHYHLLVFNFQPLVNPETNKILYHRDWQIVDKNTLMNTVDVEAVIYKAWKKGIVQVQPLEGGAIRYLANYLIDFSVQKVYDEEIDQEKQFALMSRRPPIGYQYYTDKQAIKYHRATDGEKLSPKNKFRLMLERATFQQDNGNYALPRLYKKKLYTKIEQKIIGEMYQSKEIDQLKRIKNLRLFSKNISEANELLNDKLNKRNPKRKL